MLLRTLAGLSTSVLVGLLAATVSSVIALVMGAVAALGGKKADAVVTWLIDLMMGIPHIVLLILISFALGKGFWGVAIGVAVTHWPSLTRVLRAEILQCKQSAFVAVARKLGQSPARIATRHMLPYVLPQFLVGLILLFPHAILHEAAVTFLGFGLPPEQPGHRRHPQRVDGVPLGRHVVARRVPGPRAHRDRALVRLGGIEPPQARRPAQRAGIGGAKLGEADGKGSERPARTRSGRDVAGSAGGPAGGRASRCPAARGAAARGRAGAPPSHACAGFAPRAWPSSAAGGGFERGLPHVPGGRAVLPREAAHGAGHREPEHLGARGRDRGRGGRVGLRQDAPGRRHPGPVRAERHRVRPHLVRRRTSGRRIPRGPARSRYLARAAKREQPRPAHEGGSAGGGVRAHGRAPGHAPHTSPRVVRALRVGRRCGGLYPTSCRAAWRGACSCAVRSWTTRAS